MRQLLSMMKSQELVEDDTDLWNTVKWDIIDLNQPATIDGGFEDFLLLENPQADALVLNHLAPQYQDHFYLQLNESKGRPPKLESQINREHDLSIHNQNLDLWSSQMNACDPKLVVVVGDEHVVTEHNLINLLGDKFFMATCLNSEGKAVRNAAVSKKHFESLSPEIQASAFKL